LKVKTTENHTITLQMWVSTARSKIDLGLVMCMVLHRKRMWDVIRDVIFWGGFHCFPLRLNAAASARDEALAG
jgi:hypothetical protein